MPVNTISRFRLSNNNAAKGQTAILFAALLWGTTGTVASFASQLSSLAIGAFAMGIGGVLLATMARKKLLSDAGKLTFLKKELIIGALAVATYPLAFYSSMQFAGVAIGTVVSIGSAPFATALLERLFSKNPTLDKRWFLSVVIGLIGIILLTYSEDAGSLQDGSNSVKITGVLLGILAGVTYAVYSWVARSMIEKGIQSESAMGSLFALSALILLPSLLFTGEHLFSNMTNIMVVCYMAVIPMFIGYLAFGFGLRYVHASKATLLTLFEPVVAALLAVLIVGESISLVGWFGIVLVITCLFLQSQNKTKMIKVNRS